MALSASPPTLYEYYTAGGVTSGLSIDKPYFTLNDRNITLYSGAMHYFRVPRKYWRDRLRKMRAAGLNTVETYVPWNLHEPQEGSFDFGNGGSDMEDFLHVEEFLRIAKEEDLFTIVRPGPYICSEWEFGGLPSWLLRNDGIQLRSSHPTFMNMVTRYFNVLLPILAALQFTNGGSIIGFQVENEYGNYVVLSKPDRNYLLELRQLMLDNGIKELLLTSDTPLLSGLRGTIPEYFLHTANFKNWANVQLGFLKLLQGKKPLMAMEFWTGWFDHWSEQHQQRNNEDFRKVLEDILAFPASVNMYMFHGGTSWGFMNGANLFSIDNYGYSSDTTSYDYDAPLSENGDYSEKYYIVKNTTLKYNKEITKIPNMPTLQPRKAYPTIEKYQQLHFDEIVAAAPKILSQKLLAMEMLPINNNSGQSYGYITYRKINVTLPKNSVIKIGGRVADTVMVLLNGDLISKPLTKASDLNKFGTWRVKDSKLDIQNHEEILGANLELVVENWGRINFGLPFQMKQFKGLWQAPVYINDKEVVDWEIVSLEFKKSWTNSLNGWHTTKTTVVGPKLYKFTFEVSDEPKDTYIDMRNWTKGIVMVNGFVLGRYARMGPQQTLYLPAPLFHQGTNDIVVFEHFTSDEKLRFTDNPIYITI